MLAVGGGHMYPLRHLVVYSQMRGHNYNCAPARTFDRIEPRGEFDSSENRKHRNSRPKILRNSNLLFNYIYSQRNFFNLLRPSLGTLARHTHVAIC